MLYRERLRCLVSNLTADNTEWRPPDAPVSASRRRLDVGRGIQNNAGSATASASLAPCHGADTESGNRKGGREMDSSTSAAAAGEAALPPEDDVCSVCHDRFRIPCQANCSHWFCGKSLPLPCLLSLLAPRASPLFPLRGLTCSFPSRSDCAEGNRASGRPRRTVSYRFGAGCLLFFSPPCR